MSKVRFREHRVVKRIVGSFITAGLMASLVAHASTVFDIQFDDQGGNAGNAGVDGPIIPPVIGTGIFTSPIDLGPGIYTLTSLPGFLLDLTIAGHTYDQTDIATPLTGVAVRIVQFGAQERLFFTESGGPGSDGGFGGGALDFSNDGRVLSFEPTFAGGNFLYQEKVQFDDSGESGRYLALSAVPEPGSVVLLSAGLVGLLFRRRTGVGSRKKYIGR